MLFSNRKTVPPGRDVETLFIEMRRVESLLTGICLKLDDPDCELDAAMRLSVTQKELQGYLLGLRYAMGEDVTHSTSAFMAQFTKIGTKSPA